ncbi:hypothetical protein [Lactococcus lactis]|uniref:hypothetical protein n=1 Tax=Lactococcus lactis TaxID=1358 RepID=UPI0018A8D74E|nr:hypothetical protein [Lactococcus lactis]
MKSSWKKQRQTTKKRQIKWLRIKHRLIKRYAPNIEDFIKLSDDIRRAISNISMAIGKAFINIGKSLRPSNTTVSVIDVPPIGLGADMKCYVEDIPGGRS